MKPTIAGHFFVDADGGLSFRAGDAAGTVVRIAPPAARPYARGRALRLTWAARLRGAWEVLRGRGVPY